MPLKPPRICSCGRVVPDGLRCECQIARNKESKRRYDDRRGTAAERGYDARWRRYRLVFLRQHPLCAKCEDRGDVTPATVVNHKIPHRGNQALFWDPKNHEPLCARCHNVIAQSEEKRAASAAREDEGP